MGFGECGGVKEVSLWKGVRLWMRNIAEVGRWGAVVSSVTAFPPFAGGPTLLLLLLLFPSRAVGAGEAGRD